MNHDDAFRAARLRGLALQLERGEHDAELLSIAARRVLIVTRIRQLADAIERGE